MKLLSKIAILALVLLIALLGGGCPPPPVTVTETVIKLVSDGQPLGAGAPGGMNITLSADKKFVWPGDNFTVSVLVQPAVGAEVAGVQFDLSFNKLALKVNEITEGPFFFKNAGGTYAGSFFNAGTIINGSGKLEDVFGAILGQGQFVSSAGVFAQIRCTALNPLQTSAFALSGVVIGSRAGVSLPLGSITLEQVSVLSLSDLNSDGVVDDDDIGVLLDFFGDSGAPGWVPADINRDGNVNILDLILLGQDFGG